MTKKRSAPKRRTTVPQIRMVVSLLRGSYGHEVFLGTSLNPFCNGKLTGPGGKIKRGESVFAATYRETKEEIGYKPDMHSMKEIGSMTVRYPDRVLHITFVECLKWDGRLKRNPKDFRDGRFWDQRQIHKNRLPKGDSVFLSAVLDGYHPVATVVCGKTREDVISYKIEYKP